MKVTVLYVWLLLAPLRMRSARINRDYELALQSAAYNFGAPLDQNSGEGDRDLVRPLCFIIHVDGEMHGFLPQGSLNLTKSGTSP